MSKDLEETLRELGPDYRSVVDRLRLAYEPRAVEIPSSVERLHGHLLGDSAGYLIAASLLVLFSIAVLFAPRSATPSNEYFLAREKTSAAVREIIRTQRPDGSWANDFLTRQNAAALERSTVAGANLAYRKAMRNLRLRGLL